MRVRKKELRVTRKRKEEAYKLRAKAEAAPAAGVRSARPVKKKGE